MRAWTERLQDAVNAWPQLAFGLLTVFYIIAVYVLSRTKLLWFDELITLHIAALPNAHAIWQALAGGADPNPPLIHLLVHACRRLFGEREFALRLPDVIGYWLGMLSLFAYLRRRVPGIWALAGTVLSMAMGGFEYSYESRSYAVFYGFAMAAFFCWSETVAPASSAARRRVTLIGMAFALALGICTNYFAVLAFMPIAAGELVRTFRTARVRRILPGSSSAGLLRSIDLRIWLAMLVRRASPARVPLSHIPLHRPVCAVRLEQGVDRSGVELVHRDGGGCALSDPCTSRVVVSDDPAGQNVCRVPHTSAAALARRTRNRDAVNARRRAAL